MRCPFEEKSEFSGLIDRCNDNALITLIAEIEPLETDRGRVLLADHESAGSLLVDLNLAALDAVGMARLQRHWGSCSRATLCC